MASDKIGEYYDKETGAPKRKFVPIQDIRSDTISFEQILLQKLNRLDNLFSEAAESLDRKKLRRLKTELENFSAWVYTIGSEEKKIELQKALSALRLRIAAAWGFGADPNRSRRWDIFLMLKDYFSVLKIYSMSYGRILPHENRVLLVGKGVFEEKALLKKIIEIEPVRPKKAFRKAETK